MPSHYSTAYSIFNGKYHVNFNLYNEYVNGKVITAIDDFASEADPKAAEVDSYVTTLATAFRIYMNNKVRIKENQGYDLSDVSLGDFIIDFDNLMKGIRTEEAENNQDASYKYEKFAGLTLDQISQQAWNRINTFNKPLHKIWADQIRNGSLPIDEMRNVTAKAHQFLRNTTRQAYTASPRHNDLANVVMAKNAMKQAIKNRSFWSYLNPRNWRPYRRETAYYNELKEQIRSYENNNLPLDEVVEDYEDNMLDTLHTDLIQYVNEHAATNQINNQVKESIQINSNTYEQIPNTELDRDDLSRRSSISSVSSNDENAIDSSNNENVIDNSDNNNVIDSSDNDSVDSDGAAQENDNNDSVIENENNEPNENGHIEEQEQKKEEEENIEATEEIKEETSEIKEDTAETVSQESNVATTNVDSDPVEANEETESINKEPENKNYKTQYEDASDDPDIESSVVSQIEDILRVNLDHGEKRLPETAKEILNIAKSYMYGNCEEMDGEYDEASRENIMLSFTKNSFEVVYMEIRNAHVYYDENRVHRVIAAQKVTNLLLNTYTPVKFDAEKYGKYADNYALNHREALKEALSNLNEDCTYSDEDYNQFTEDLDNELNKAVSNDLENEDIPTDELENPEENEEIAEETETELDETKSNDSEKERMKLEEFEKNEEVDKLSERVEATELIKNALNK